MGSKTEILYFFSTMSPWTYLGHQQFMEMTSKAGIHVVLKPLPLGEIFAETGGLPLKQRHPARQHYRWWEMQRWQHKRGIPFTIKPKHWPFDARLADKIVISMCDIGEEVAAEKFAFKVLKGSWADELDCGDEGQLRTFLIEALGKGKEDKVEKLFEMGKSDEAAAKYSANVKEAQELGVIGAPVYVRDGEVSLIGFHILVGMSGNVFPEVQCLIEFCLALKQCFWGQDRLDLLEDAIKEGRDGFKSPI